MDQHRMRPPYFHQMLNTNHLQLVAIADLETELRAREETPGVELATQLVHAARWALENASTLAAVRDVKDHLRAAQVYFQQKHATMVATNLLSAELIRCQWRLGSELLRLPRNQGERTLSNSGTKSGFEAMLAEIELKKSSAYRLQMLAQVDAQDLDAYLFDLMEKDEITTIGVLNYFTSQVTVDPRSDAESYEDGDHGDPPDTSDELPQPHTVNIVCRHCGTKDSYEV